MGAEPTRKAVARYAGVSESTVSYVVNNGPRPVSPETRQRVLDAIAVLGYQPNAVAQSLRRQHTTIIGLIVPDTANPFYGQVARVVENACDDFGYAVMVCNTGGSQARAGRYLEQLAANRVAGIICLPTGEDRTTAET
jgi:LacI family transcriptional regulator